MAYTNLKLDKVVDQVANAFGKSFRGSHALVSNMQKHIIPKGTNSVKVPIPASLAASKRVAGGASVTPATPAPTVATLTAATEHTTTIRVDRLDAVGTQYSIQDFEAVSAADAILGSVNSDAWTLVSALSNDVGTAGDVPALQVLNSAWTTLFTNKVAPNSQLIAVVGGEEWQAWKNGLTVNEDGVLGSGVRANGNINSAYGFDVFPDQQRPGTSGTDAVNVAFQPYALACAYRSVMEQVEGTSMAQATDPITGITVFATLKGYSDSNGEGNLIEFTVVADPVTVYDSWAVQILG